MPSKLKLDLDWNLDKYWREGFADDPVRNLAISRISKMFRDHNEFVGLASRD